MNHELFILDLHLVAKRSPRFLGNGQASCNNR